MSAPAPSALGRALGLLSSLGLSAVVFGLLMLLTYLGTLYQVDHGLHAAQRKYFEALVVFHDLGRLSVPLPGAQSLLMVLFVNLLLGGLIRMRMGWGQAGILLAHLGMLLLLTGGFLSQRYALSGHITLYENQSADVFKSHDDWEIAVSRQLEDGSRAEVVIPQSDFVHLRDGRVREFAAADFPFRLALSNYLPNATPRRAGQGAGGQGSALGGFELQALPTEPARDRNVAGIHATLAWEPGGERRTLLLWGARRSPASVEIDGEEWTFDLRRRQWPLPFTIALNTFIRELHPRTNMPSKLASEVTKLQNGVAERARITMNQPLRHAGYTIYQASWGPADAGPGDPLFTTLAVIRNPAERLPMIACIVTTAGMLLHFLLRLLRHLDKERRQWQCVT